MATFTNSSGGTSGNVSRKFWSLSEILEKPVPPGTRENSPAFQFQRRDSSGIPRSRERTAELPRRCLPFSRPVVENHMNRTAQHAKYAQELFDPCRVGRYLRGFVRGLAPTAIHVCPLRRRAGPPEEGPFQLFSFSAFNPLGLLSDVPPGQICSARVSWATCQRLNALVPLTRRRQTSIKCAAGLPCP